MFYLHCFDKEEKEVLAFESRELAAVINVAENQCKATLIEVYSSLWPHHHLAANVNANCYLDWFRVPF
jgi:hypothetical protein